MTAICIYFQVHQPMRIGNYGVFDIGKHSDYFDEKKNEEIMKKVARKCYIPTNKILLEQIKKNRGKFKIAFSITGIAMEQFERYAPEVLDLFKEMADTGCVEFLSETYYHSLSYIFSKEEFKEQVIKHSKMIQRLFGQKPRIFRNTELIYNNELAMTVSDMGYEGIIAEGADHILGWRSPNFVYTPVTAKNLKLFLKNYKLSDDVAFRFSNKGWGEYPLTTDKFANWLSAVKGDTVNLFMDYETFGEHHWEDTGILDFLSHLPGAVSKHKHLEFMMPSQMLNFEPVSELDVHNFTSWADIERDLSAWMGNPIQNGALSELYKIEEKIKRTNDLQLLEDWRKLTTSDHFYYMCIKWFNDGDVHKYFNPYDSPYDAYISFMNVLNDMVIRVKKKNPELVDESPKLIINETPSVSLEQR